MKKIFAVLCGLASILCVVTFAACGLFGDDGSNEDGAGPDTTYAKVGETVTNSDNVSICLVKVENTKILGTEYLNDTTENNYVLLTIKVVNNSKKTQTFYGSCVDLYNSQNTKYEAKTSLYIDYIISEDVGVGISKTFQVVFETPSTTKNERYLAKIGYSTYTLNSKRVTFDLSK